MRVSQPWTGTRTAKARRSTALLSTREDGKVDRVSLLIRTSEKLAPYDRQLYNKAMAIWEEVETLQPKQRMKLLQRLSDKDIQNLWYIAGDRYKVDASIRNKVMGPEYSVRKEFPFGFEEARPTLSGGEDPSFVRYQGRAIGVPPFLRRFEKVFWMPPMTTDLKGRVLLRKGSFLGSLWPLYFNVNLASSVVPGTGELADTTLEYLDPNLLGLDVADIPELDNSQKMRSYWNKLLLMSLVTAALALYVASRFMRVTLVPVDALLRNLLQRPFFLAFTGLFWLMATALVAAVTLPETSPWPFPRRQLPPFSGLVDYLRHVGPGVFVGVGWKPPGRRPPTWWPWENWNPWDTSQLPKTGLNGERKFFTFIMVRST